MPSLISAEARLARKSDVLSIEMSGWSARVSRTSADSLWHVGNGGTLCAIAGLHSVQASEVTAIRSSLLAGFSESLRDGTVVLYRLLSATDDLQAITRMLHSAYQPLADAGMLDAAAYHDVEVTRHRVTRGDTIVAELAHAIVGIITLRGPGGGSGCAHYRRHDVAAFGQFAIDPAHQRRGIGTRLLEIVESLAREKGAAELALDTWDRAVVLLRLYHARGFRTVDSFQWPDTHYRSIVLSKPLQGTNS